jgi:hypothetical protein
MFVEADLFQRQALRLVGHRDGEGAPGDGDDPTLADPFSQGFQVRYLGRLEGLHGAGQCNGREYRASWRAIEQLRFVWLKFGSFASENLGVPGSQE